MSQNQTKIEMSLKLFSRLLFMVMMIMAALSMLIYSAYHLGLMNRQSAESNTVLLMVLTVAFFLFWRLSERERRNYYSHDSLVSLPTINWERYSFILTTPLKLWTRLSKYYRRMASPSPMKPLRLKRRLWISTKRGLKDLKHKVITRQMKEK